MLEHLRSRIEEAALDPGAWWDLQIDLQRYFGAACAQLARCDHDKNNRFWSRTTEIPEFDQEFAEIGRYSEPARYCQNNRAWQTFVDYDYIDEAGINRSFFYDRNARYGIRYRMGIKLLDSPGLAEAVVLGWRARDGHAQRAHLERLAAIHGMLKLAARVADMLGRDFSAERGIVDGLQRSGRAAVIVEPDLSVLMANPAAEDLLSTSGGLAIRGGRLEAISGKARADLQRAVSRAAAGKLSDDAASVAAPANPAAMPIVVTASPLPEKHQLFGPSRRLVLLLFFDPRARRSAPGTLLKRSLGLTTAEADVASGLAAGETLAEIAERRRAGVATVRHQLKAAMQKLGVRRQVDLVRLVLGLSTP